MPSSGPNSPVSGTDDAAVGTVTWLLPGSIVSSDDVRSTAVLSSGGGTTHYLKALDFGFAIPAGAAIVGILVEVEKAKSAGAPTINDNIAKLVIGGAVVGDNKPGAAWSTTEAYVSYGGSADLWGLTPTVAEVNGADFGFVLSATGGLGAAGYTLSADHMRVTVTYTVPGGMVCSRSRFKRQAYLRR